MARWRERVMLENGPRLDLNKLIRNEIIEPGRHTIWRLSFSDGSRARLEAEMRPGKVPRLMIEHGGKEQEISLCFAYRHFGGRQWYFTCPRTHERVSVLWKPPGSPFFASRHAYGRQVAYCSQFQSPRDRALATAQDIRRRLGGEEWVSGLDGFPPKPKGMRWATYERLQDKCDAHQNFALASIYVYLRKLVR